MLRNLLRVLIVCSVVVLVPTVAAFADDRAGSRAIQEEVLVMNHGVSLNPRERGFFPLVEFSDAAMWFARRGYMVGAPAGSGYGFFGPELSKRMHEAYTGAGGNAEYHLLPAFGSDGHFLVTSPDSIPLWAPLVGPFLDKHG